MHIHGLEHEEVRGRDGERGNRRGLGEGRRREKLGGRGAGAAWAVGERGGQPGGEGRGGREEQGAGGLAERIDGVAACGGEMRGRPSDTARDAGDAEVRG